MTIHLFARAVCLTILLGSPVLSARAADAPRMLTTSPETLARTKARVQSNDASLKAAVDRLRRDADKALKAGPFSVMDKPIVPPSGDKHDYLSRAPYFWPNPDSKDGLPYIRRDGEVNPQSRTGTDSPSIGRLSSAVPALALAYYFTGDEQYARHAATLLRTWFLDPATRMNPNLNFGQGIPGQTTGRGTGIIDTRGLIDIFDVAGLLDTSSNWTPADRQGLKAWCKEYVHWLRTSKLGRQEGDAKNNHGSWYDAQVVAMAMYYGDDEAARQVLEASKKRFAGQIKPDGSQPAELARTKSFGYSLYNLRAWFALASLGDRAGVDLWHYRSAEGGSVQAALDFVAPYAETEKKWPYKELRFDRKALIPILLEADAVYGGDRYRKLLEQFPSDEAAASRARLMYSR